MAQTIVSSIGLPGCVAQRAEEKRAAITDSKALMRPGGSGSVVGDQEVA